jgi:hypothetical protein
MNDKTESVIKIVDEIVDAKYLLTKVNSLIKHDYICIADMNGGNSVKISSTSRKAVLIAEKEIHEKRIQDAIESLRVLLS